MRANRGLCWRVALATYRLLRRLVRIRVGLWMVGVLTVSRSRSIYV